MPRAAATRLLVALAAALGVLALALAGPAPAAPPAALAREFGIRGTVDCGQRSGRSCPIGDELAVWTRDISGVPERVVVAVAWIRRQLEELGLDQDDEVCLQVQDGPGGRLEAIGLVDPCDQEPPEEAEDDDEDGVTPPAPRARGATPTPTPTRTPARLPDLTVAKSDSEDPVASGETFTHTASVRKVGAARATDVVLEERFIFEAFFDFAIFFLEDDGGFTVVEVDEDFDPFTSVVFTLRRAELGAGQSATVRWSVIVGTAETTTVTQEARVDPDDAVDEVDEGNNADTETTTVEPGATDGVIQSAGRRSGCEVRESDRTIEIRCGPAE